MEDFLTERWPATVLVTALTEVPMFFIFSSCVIMGAAGGR